MAEIFPDEGVDLILSIFPKGGTNLTTTYLGLFTAFTATTVGAASSTADSYTEPGSGAYARVAVAAADWGAIAAGTGGRKTTAAQKTFPTATASWGTVNGSALFNQSSATGDTCIYAANFDDATAITVNSGDVVKVTPTMQANN